MPRIHLSGPCNSTMFTDCCGCAIRDIEARCPSCKQFIYPFYSEEDLERYTTQEVHISRWNLAFSPYKAKQKR